MAKQTEEERKEKAIAAKLKWRKAHPEYLAAYRAAHREKQKSYTAAWYKANSEKVKAASAMRYERDPEKHKANCAARYKANPEKIKAATRKRGKEHPEQKKKSGIAWRKANPEKVKIAGRQYFHNRQARKKNDGSRLSPNIASRLLSSQKNRCAICRASLKKTGYHIDHVIPLARGGKNVDRNIQLTCPKCNLEKGHKDPIAFMQERGYLL